MKRVIICLLLFLATTPPASAHRRLILFVTSDVIDGTNSGAALISELAMPVRADVLMAVRCHIFTHTNATTTGPRVGIIGPNTGTMINNVGQISYWPTTGGPTFETFQPSGVPSIFTSAFTNSRGGTTTETKLEFLFGMTGAVSGNLTPTVSSNVTATNAVVVETGSWCEYSYEEITGP